MRQLTAREFMTTALRSEYGHEITFNTPDEAKSFRMACYGVRSRDRKMQDKVYAGDPTYITTCKWDALRIDLDGSRLRAFKIDLNPETGCVSHRALTAADVGVEPGDGMEDRMESSIGVENGSVDKPV